MLLTGVTACGGAMFAMGGGLPAIAVACALVGFAGGMNTLMAATLAAEFGAKGFGRAFRMCRFFIPFLPFAVVVAAKVKEVNGSYTPAFLGLTLMLVISLCLTLLFFRQKRDAGAMPSARPGRKYASGQEEAGEGG